MNWKDWAALFVGALAAAEFAKPANAAADVTVNVSTPDLEPSVFPTPGALAEDTSESLVTFTCMPNECVAILQDIGNTAQEISTTKNEDGSTTYYYLTNDVSINEHGRRLAKVPHKVENNYAEFVHPLEHEQLEYAQKNRKNKQNQASTAESQKISLRGAAATKNTPKAANPVVEHVDEQAGDAVHQGALPGVKVINVYVLDSGLQPIYSELNPDLVEQGMTFYPSQDIGKPALGADQYGHGSHVATTIAGKNVGVNPNVNLIPLKVLSSRGLGTIGGMIKAIDYAIKAHLERKSKVSIMSMSIDAAYSSALSLKLAEAAKVGLIPVLAAGNEKMDACVRLAGSVQNVANMVTVGSISNNLERSGFSDFGPCVKVYVRGEKVIAAIDENEYVSMYGTSMATPQVSAIIADIAAHNPKYTPQQVLDAFYDKARLISEGIVKSKDLNWPKIIPTLVQEPLSQAILKPLNYKKGFIGLNSMSFKPLQVGESVEINFNIDKAGVKSLEFGLFSDAIPYEINPDRAKLKATVNYKKFAKKLRTGKHILQFTRLKDNAGHQEYQISLTNDKGNSVFVERYAVKDHNKKPFQVWGLRGDGYQLSSISQTVSQSPTHNPAVTFTPTAPSKPPTAAPESKNKKKL